VRDRNYLTACRWSALDEAGATAWRAQGLDDVAIPGIATNAM